MGRGRAILIRPARRGDLDAIRTLEEEAGSEAWPEGSLAEALAAEGPALLALEGDEPSGWIACGRAADEGEIRRFIVTAPRRRRGVGTALLGAALGILRRRGVRRIFLEVRVSNGPALEFYRKHGFRKVGRRPGYYDAGREDAVVLRTDLEEA